MPYISLSKIKSWIAVATLSVILCWIVACILNAPDLRGWICNSNQDCLEPLLCHQKNCRQPCHNELGCMSNDRCINGFCVPNAKVDSNEPDQNCIPQGEEICNAKDDNCDGQIDEGLICAQEGEMCDLMASPPIQCFENSVCTALYVDMPRICLRTCNTSTPCSAQYECLSQQKVCLQKNCTKKNDCYYNAKPHKYIWYGCEDRGGGNYCLPLYNDGDFNLGETCIPAEGKLCRSPWTCIRSAQDSNGICSRFCSDDRDCEPLQKYSVCGTMPNSTLKICK